MPDLDGISLNLADFLPSDEMEETRYTLPKEAKEATSRASPKRASDGWQRATRWAKWVAQTTSHSKQESSKTRLSVNSST